MSRKRKGDSEEPEAPKKVTDIEAADDNIKTAVEMFAERWIPLPEMAMPCEVMDVGQLRDAMGLRATIDLGDPWPTAERLLLQQGFRWHWIGSSRVMIMREREDMIPSAGWDDAEELND